MDISDSLNKQYFRLSKRISTIIIIIGIIIVGYFDYVTGNELMFSVFYLLPISLAALNLGKTMALIIAILSAAVESEVYLISGKFQYSSMMVHYWNTGILLMIYLYIAMLVSSLKKANEREKATAGEDSLTGIANWRGFLEIAEREIARSSRYGTILSAAYIDCDNFKEVNDTLGHDAGNRVLRVIADTIKKHIRTTDIAARIGGDEFVVLLTDVSQDISEEFVEKMRNLLLQEMKRNNWNVTFSIGMVTYATPPVSVEEMLKRCDALMYCVKRETKNAIKHEIV
jgi:diguanylate cyclase (GGDEF)-like protein